MLVSQSGSTIKSPEVGIVSGRYLFLYDLGCCQDVKLQQPTNQSVIAIPQSLQAKWHGGGRGTNYQTPQREREERGSLPMQSHNRKGTIYFTLSIYTCIMRFTSPKHASRYKGRSQKLCTTFVTWKSKVKTF